MSLEIADISNLSVERVRLVAYPGYGFQSETGNWKLRISGCAFQPPGEYNMRKRMILRMLRNAMQVSAAEASGDLFHYRVKPFLSDAEHRMKIYVKLDGHRFRLKKKTRRNGHFQSWLSVPDDVVDRVTEVDSFGKRSIQFQVTTNDPTVPAAEGVVYLLDRKGTSVISDIDDTIKESFVTDRRELLANTFLREFRGVEGMAGVYQDWAQRGIDFHYVSSSPWQLYDSLLQMQIDEGFPSGTLHLRSFRLRDQLLKKVLIIRRKGKVSAIKTIVKTLPERKFILIGDSGEKDPELYGKIYNKFPNQISGLFIRELPDRPVDGERFGKLNGSIPIGVCKKFSRAEELVSHAEEAIERATRRQLV